MRINGGYYMLSVTSVASYFIEQSSNLPENDLTNLKLQKILFYAQAESLQKTGKIIFEDSVEAWKYGPVVPAAYNWLKGCGAYPITTFDITTSTDGIDEPTESLLSSIWKKYSKYSAGYLVDRTHEDGSPWKNAYSDTKNNVISNDSIKTAKLQEEWQ